MRRNWLGLIALMGALALGCGDDGKVDTDAGPETDAGGDASTGDDAGTGDGGECVAALQENTEALCSDGCDNNAPDGLFDCGGGDADLADPGCVSGGFCVPRSEVQGPEDTAEACGDELDNDWDGFADCDDLDCLGTAACPLEQSNRACSDGEDNDGDGFADCEDFSCYYVDETEGAQGARVCLREMTNTACTDGDDNDGDDLVDCADPDCHGDAITACAPDSTDIVPEADRDTVEARCTDGVSNGGGELPNDAGTPSRSSDCADYTCAFFYTPCDAARPENTNATCGDGVDNDMDGTVDCADYSCVGEDGPVENIVVCDAERNEVEFADDAAITAAANIVCSNEADDDGNTYQDCNDNACQRDELVTVCSSYERNSAACSDETDNDENGYEDCDDSRCGQNEVWCPDDENGMAECSDGIDNEGDGYADCRDFSCSYTLACTGTDLSSLR